LGFVRVAITEGNTRNKSFELSTESVEKSADFRKKIRQGDNPVRRLIFGQSRRDESGIRNQGSGVRQKVKTYFLPVKVSKKVRAKPDTFL
jgi:hypothetical protein